MKRLTAILISLLTALTALYAVRAADAPQVANAYFDNGSLVIEYRSGMPDIAVAAYYSGKTLCGAYFSETDGEKYTFDIPAGYTKIRVWFTNEDKMRTVQIVDRTAFTPAPTLTPTPTPSAEPTAEPTKEPIEEDEGYGGFITPPVGDNKDENIQTFTFSVECHNALLSDELNDELRGILPTDGFIAPAMEYTLTEGMTIYDALLAASEKFGFEVKSNAGYVSAVGALGEFECGPFSGWMYLINGEAVMAPMDGYVIKDGDTVCVAYTCSFGDDLGQEVE